MDLQTAPAPSPGTEVCLGFPAERRLPAAAPATDSTLQAQPPHPTGGRRQGHQSRHELHRPGGALWVVHQPAEPGPAQTAPLLAPQRHAAGSIPVPRPAPLHLHQQQPTRLFSDQIQLAPAAAPVSRHQAPALSLQQPQGPLFGPAALALAGGGGHGGGAVEAATHPLRFPVLGPAEAAPVPPDPRSGFPARFSGPLKRLRPSLACLWFGASIRAGRPCCVSYCDSCCVSCCV